MGSWEEASRLIRRQLEDGHPEAPVEELLLELSGLGEGAGEQGSLFPDVLEGRERRLAEVERQLRERLGSGPSLYRMESIAPWYPAPEMRVLQAFDFHGMEEQRQAVDIDPFDIMIGWALSYGLTEVASRLRRLIAKLRATADDDPPKIF